MIPAFPHRGILKTFFNPTSRASITQEQFFKCGCGGDAQAVAWGHVPDIVGCTIGECTSLLLAAPHEGITERSTRALDATSQAKNTFQVFAKSRINEQSCFGDHLVMPWRCCSEVLAMFCLCVGGFIFIVNPEP